VWGLDKPPSGEGKQALGKGREGKEEEDAHVGGSNKTKTGNIASSAGAVAAPDMAGSLDGGRTTVGETSRKNIVEQPSAYGDQDASVRKSNYCYEES